MIRNASCIAAVGAALLAGCVTPPAADVSLAPAEAAPPAPSVRQPHTAAIEQAHLEKAQSHMRERRWADALVQWQILALLNPSAQNYRDEIATLRTRIRSIASGLLNAADNARRRGNLSQATLDYLRVLNVDRDNTAAAQALREIEKEQVRRQYLNRAPRVVM
jgi:outer membrane protein assembly factor BamD (BamD/ComL family)